MQQVDVVHTQALERAVDALEQVFAIECIGLVGLVVQPPEQLGRNQVATAPPAELPDRGPHDFLGFTVGIAFSVIEEIDAGIIGGRHDLCGGIDIRLIVKSDPGPEREFADLQSGLSKMAIIHDLTCPYGSAMISKPENFATLDLRSRRFCLR
jgi:hypothetical protein